MSGKGMRKLAALLVWGSALACDDGNGPTALASTVEITEEVLRLRPGEQKGLTVQLSAGAAVEWKVQDAAVATVGVGGAVHALTPGMTWVTAASGEARDSARVVVSFATVHAAPLAVSLGEESNPILLTGVSRIYRYLNGADSYTSVTAAAGSPPSPDLELEDFFTAADTMVILRLQGVVEPGFRTVEPWRLENLGEGRYRLRGAEGAMVWVRNATDPELAEIYVPVENVQLEIDRSEVPHEVGPATGRLSGRMSFESAGLLVRFGEDGARIVGQVSTETTRVFAEFELSQRIHPLGVVRTTVTGGPLPLEPRAFATPRVGLWKGGLLVNTAGRTGDDRVYSTQVWLGGPVVGTTSLDDLALGELMDETALGVARAWAWTESGFRDQEANDQSEWNLGLSNAGRVTVTRYQPAVGDVWGLLEATAEVEETMFVGGAPGAVQTVTLEILAPVAPASEVVFPHKPSVVVNGEDVAYGPGVVRVGNGPVQLPGRVVETSVSPVEGVPITLAWEGGSASVLTNASGEFLFTGAHPGRYEVRIDVPEGYDLARGQRAVIAPLDLAAGHRTWLPVYLSDAEGNGGLWVAAGAVGVNAVVDGVVLRIRRDGSETVLTTLVTGDEHPGSGMTETKLPPGRYQVDVEVPAGYRLQDGQAGTVTVEVYKGRQSSLHVGVVKG